MKVFSVQEIEKSSSGVAGIKIRGTFFDDKKAREFYNKIVKEAMQKDWLYSHILQGSNHGFITLGLGRSAWGTHDGALHQFDLIVQSIDVPTVYEDCTKAKLTTEDVRKGDFESRFEHELGNIIIESNEKSVEGDESLENMLYNSGEFTIVFQCDDPSKTVATCLPYEAESYNQIVEAIRTFIKDCY